MDKDRDVSGIADATLAQGPFVSDQAEYPQHKSGGLSTAEPPLVRLTRIKPVPLTGVWSTEPHHFTPWLLENAELLSEVLGIDVELEAREYPVGKFWLDIIGREVASGTPVIIENQFGPTDHGHLGQILTYAGGTKPSTIIWVAEQFREEHRAVPGGVRFQAEGGLPAAAP